MEKAAQIGLKSRRLLWLDLLRGAAIVLMTVFHLFYDLSYFRFLSISIATDPLWVSFRALIVSLFLFAVGVSLAVVHRRGIRWRAVGRRALVLGLAAGAVTLATYRIFPGYWVYFGILHLIWLSSLLGLPFLRHPRASLLSALFILIGTARGWLTTEALFARLQPLLHHALSSATLSK